MSEGLTISAVIPVRNRPQFIARAIDSINLQTIPCTEIIVVDDASTDDTPDVVETMVKKQSNLHLIKLTKNVGAARARNIGVENAKGEVLAFLDSDDVWYPEKLEKQIKEFHANPNVIAVLCGVKEVTDESSIRHIPPADMPMMAFFHRGRGIGCSAVVVLKHAFNKIGGFDALLPSCQDWDLLMRLAEIGKVRTVQEVLIEYDNHAGKRISNDKSATLRGGNIFIDKTCKRLSDPRTIRRIRAYHECWKANFFCVDRPRRAFRHALRALATFPSPRNIFVLARTLKHCARNELRRIRMTSAS